MITSTPADWMDLDGTPVRITMITVPGELAAAHPKLRLHSFERLAAAKTPR